MSLRYNEILNNQLPDIYINDNLEVNVVGNTLNKIQSDVDILEREVNPITCESDGLAKWEGFFKLPSNISEDIESRRAKVITEIIQFVSDENVVTKVEMINLINKFVENKSAYIREHFAEFLFDIVFNIDDTIYFNEIIPVVKKVKPSYLLYDTYLQAPIENKEKFDITQINRSIINFQGTRTLYLDGTWTLDGSQTFSGIWGEYTEQHNSQIENRVFIKSDEKFGSKLRIEKNLWYLDGNVMLNGSELLNAEIIEEVL